MCLLQECKMSVSAKILKVIGQFPQSAITRFQFLLTVYVSHRNNLVYSVLNLFQCICVFVYLYIVFVSVKQRVDLLEAAKLPICDVRCQVKCSQAGQVESNMKYRASGIKYIGTFKVESNIKYRKKYNHIQIQGQVQEDKYRHLNRKYKFKHQCQ